MALVTTGEFDGAIVDTRTVGRPVGDTNSSAVFLSDLPKNFHGGDEALHFALGELFGQYGKIKKIELYMDEGILETQDFKGEALVVFHKTKKTGSRDKGDPVYESCTDMDGKYRILGKRGWRIRCEAAAWQKEGYDVKKKAKVFPCVEISNLWEYDPSQPMSHFAEMQEAIRRHAEEHIENPFVKVEPSAGTATIWCKGAQDAMKFASMMHKSFFLGRKITSSLCRKEKPIEATMRKIDVGELTMKLPTKVWDGTGPIPGLETLESLAPAGPIAEVFSAVPEAKQEAPEEPAGPVMGPQGPPPALKRGSKVRVCNLVNKPENNGKIAEVVSFVEDLDKYQVSLGGRLVKLKRENLELVEEPAPANKPKKARALPAEEKEEDADAAEDEASTAFEAAAKWASGDVRHGPVSVHDPKVDGFLATVCVDPSLLPTREVPEDPEEVEARARRERSRSRGRRQEERIAAVKARLEAEGGSRPSWVVPSPEELAAQAAAKAGSGGAASAVAKAPLKEPEESREELMKFSVGKLKELLREFGKSARGCLEKRDFVDRLKPAPKE